jgi:hypothetical protein
VSGQLLLLLKFVLLGLLYLFLFRVVRAVWAEISATRQPDGVPASGSPSRSSDRRRQRGPSGVPLSTPPVGGAAGTSPASAAPPSRPVMTPRAHAGRAVASALVVVAPDALADRRFALDGDVVTVGRGAPSTLVLDDAFVSMAHARLRRLADGWVVEDLGSTNGTTLNGAPVSGPQPLAPGDQVTFGGVILDVR